jgi:hypothetical protein
MPRVKRWVPGFQTFEPVSYPFYPVAFNLSELDEFAVGETLLRTHVTCNMELNCQDTGTAAYPAPWRRITTAIALVWTPEGGEPLGYYSATDLDYLFVAQVRWDMQSYLENPTATQIRGTWSKNTADSAVIDTKSERIATSTSSSIWLTIDCLPDSPTDPSQFKPYININSRYLVDGVS